MQNDLSSSCISLQPSCTTLPATVLAATGGLWASSHSPDGPHSLERVLGALAQQLLSPLPTPQSSPDPFQILPTALTVSSGTCPPPPKQISARL